MGRPKYLAHKKLNLLTKTMCDVQRHFVLDNRLEFAAAIPGGPAIIPNNDP